MHQLGQVFPDLGMERGVLHRLDLEIDIGLFQERLHRLDSGEHARQRGVDRLDGHSVGVAGIREQRLGFLDVVKARPAHRR